MTKENKSFKASFMLARREDGTCRRIPGGMLKCTNDFRCYACVFADRAQRASIADPTFFGVVDENTVMPEKHEGLVYYHRLVAVREFVLERFSFDSCLYHQLFWCEDGPGCLPQNKVGAIDGYFFSDPNKPVTLLRSDILGVPTFAVCRRFDNFFFTNTVRDCGHFKGGGAI